MSESAEKQAVFDVSARVPLGPPSSGLEPSDTGIRPFGLRFTRELPVGDPPPVSRYCPERQIALSAEPDSEGVPWHYVVGTSMTTTGQSTDGQGSTGNEEWTPDKMAFT